MKFFSIIVLLLIISVSSFSQKYESVYANNEMKILSWNIYMLPYINLLDNLDLAKVISDELENSDYQIIVFQEAFSNRCRSLISKKLLKKYPYQYGPANKKLLSLKTNSGLWIVSKVPLKKLGEIQFTQSKGFDMVARKGAVLFEGVYNGYSFQLLSTHLQANYSNDLRNLQCQEIKEHLLNKYYNKNVTQLICGDFNIDFNDKIHYNKMLKILDATDGEMNGNIKVTYDELNNNLAYQSNGNSKTIDYVLIRNSNLIHDIEREVKTFLSKVKGIKYF